MKHFSLLKRLLRGVKAAIAGETTDLTGYTDEELVEALMRPKPTFNDEWRCTFCAAEGRYVLQLGPGYGQTSRRLMMKCGRDRSNDGDYSVACPLIPIDSNGKEIPLEQLFSAR